MKTHALIMSLGILSLATAANAGCLDPSGVRNHGCMSKYEDEVCRIDARLRELGANPAALDEAYPEPMIAKTCDPSVLQAGAQPLAGECIAYTASLLKQAFFPDPILRLNPSELNERLEDRKKIYFLLNEAYRWRDGKFTRELVSELNSKVGGRRFNAKAAIDGILEIERSEALCAKKTLWSRERLIRALQK